MVRLVAATAARIKRAWAELVVQLRSANPVAELQHRLHVRQLAGLDTAIEGFAAAQHTAFLGAGMATVRWAAAQLRAQIRKKELTFDEADPGVMSWAEQNRLDLIRDIDFETRVMIRYALSVAAET